MSDSGSVDEMWDVIEAAGAGISPASTYVDALWDAGYRRVVADNETVERLRQVVAGSFPPDNPYMATSVVVAILDALRGDQ